MCATQSPRATLTASLPIIGSGFGSCCIGSCCIGSCCIRNFCLVRFGIGRVAPGHEQRVIAAGLPEQAC